MNGLERSLDEQHKEFLKRRFIATPLAGMLVWALIGLSTFIVPANLLPFVLFILTGSIVYIGMFISKLTGENFLDKTRPKNTFDHLFLLTVGMAVLVYSIAIPFFMIEPSSLPLTIGVLTGLMWLPFSWIIQHWMCAAHGIVRTVLVLLAWYLFPENQYLAISLVIVILYAFIIYGLNKRWLEYNKTT